MLTNKDFEKIRLIVREEVQSQLKPAKEDVAQTKRDIITIKQDMSLIKKDMLILKQDVALVKKNLVIVKKDIIQIRKDQKIIVNFFDHEYLELRRRVERIEEHLNLQSL